jgi:hypothetical protein
MATTDATPVAAVPVSTPAPAAPAAIPASTPETVAAPAAAAPAAAAPAAPPAASSGTPEKPAESAAPTSLLKPPAEKKEEKKDDTAPGTQPKGTPAEVVVKVPEGVTVNGSIVDEFKELAQKVGLDSAKAQQVFDLGLKMQQSLVEDMGQALQKYQTDSIVQLKKEWGPQFDSNVVAAQKVIDRFGDPKLLEELAGMENSPAVMRTLAAIGRALGEDSIAIPGAHSAPPDESPKTGNSVNDKFASLAYNNTPGMRKD